MRPSVDTTLEDVAETFGPAVLAVILTGMGEDVTAGARALKAAGGIVLAGESRRPRNRTTGGGVLRRGGGLPVS